MTGDACVGGRQNSCAAGVAGTLLPIGAYSTGALARGIGTSTNAGRLAGLQNWTTLSLQAAAYYQAALGVVVSGGIMGGDSNQWWSAGS